MAVTLHKASIDPWANKPVHESVLHLRRIQRGRRLSWTDREELRSNDPNGLRYVLRTSPHPKQYTHDYDDLYGSWGVWDNWEGVFVGHSGSETGARIMARKLNQGVL